MAVIAVRKHRLAADILVAGAAVGTALAIFGWLRHPATNLLSVAAAAAVFLVYALAGRFILPLSARAEAAWLPVATTAGIVAGLVFCCEIGLEYILLPRDNSRFGLVEFGTVWLIYFIVAAIIATTGGSLRSSVGGAVIAGMISSIMWCVCLLAAFHLLEGTWRQTAVFLAEGEFEDFRHSGMSSFPTFVMEDLFGATFFHLLLGPLIAAVLACGAWTIARGVTLLQHST